MKLEWSGASTAFVEIVRTGGNGKIENPKYRVIPNNGTYTDELGKLQNQLLTYSVREVGGPEYSLYVPIRVK